MRQLLLIWFIFLQLCVAQLVYGADIFADKTFGDETAVLVTDDRGRVLYAWQPTKRLIPASLMKIVTAQQALEQWGGEYRLHTDFFLMDNVLWVKGYGDPFLISEELDRIATQMAKVLQGVAIEAVAIDASYFQDVRIDSRTTVNDPYNAPLSAVASNFNTIHLLKKHQRVFSAEPQTPLTPTAIKLADKLAAGKHRINVGNAALGQRYFAELLATKLRAHAVSVGEKVILDQTLPAEATHLYHHQNSHSISDILHGALVYSNNFIANQLFMLLGAEPDASYVTKGKAQQAVARWLRNKFAEKSYWQQFVIEEGAGLSRKNRLSARQITDVLFAFESNKELLKPYKNGIVRAKTGTLHGVRTFAGYIDLDGRQDLPSYYFVFLFNQPVPYQYRERLLDELLIGLRTLQR